MGCKASFCSQLLAIAKIAKLDKKNNAADRPRPADHNPRGVMHKVLSAS